MIVISKLELLTLVSVLVYLILSIYQASGKSTRFNRLDYDYDFVFGFSTGHCGTTSLSSGDITVYTNFQKKVVIKHEHFRVSPKEWSTWKYKDEYDYVKKVYVPEILRIKGKADTYMDLGHHNVYFIDALVDYLTNETKYQFAIIRIRRERFSLALSLMFSSGSLKKSKHEDICQLGSGYCPKDRKEDVIIAVSNKDWNSMTTFQQALWLQDETEERWQRLIDKNPTMHRYYVFWTIHEINSFNEAIYTVSKIINADPIVDTAVITAAKEKRIHAHNLTSTKNIREHEDEYMRMDRDYQDRIRREQGYHTFTLKL